MSKFIFAPGCALMCYKPHLAKKLYNFLQTKYGEQLGFLDICCKKTPAISTGMCVINVCPGCDKRYRMNYSNSTTISLWEVLSEDNTFPFPNYRAEKMTIIDACPTRGQKRIHSSVRKLAEKMNISIIEPKNTKEKSTCCGDSFFGILPNEKVINAMVAKAKEMPLEKVLVYCVSCSKSMFIGKKQPRYLVDLLFNEDTVPKTCDIVKWHKELDSYCNKLN